MFLKDFIYKNSQTQFQLLEKSEFTFDNNIHCYDYIYRLFDTSGNFTFVANSFDGDGYGFATVVKMSAIHLEQLDKNIKCMVENCIDENFINKNLLVNFHDESVGYSLMEGVNIAILVKVIKEDAYVIIFDSMANYNNYYFLFSNIHDFKNANMSNIDTAKENIKDKKNNFYFYYGDENTDANFSEWLEENASQIYKKFIKLDIIT